MKLVRGIVLVAMAAVAFAPAPRAIQAIQDAPSPAPVVFTAEQMEALLLKGRITNRRNLDTGVTGSQRVTLTDGAITHDAHVQTVDIERPVFRTGNAVELNFRDLARYNVTGYRLARFLGLDNVPMSVERVIGGRLAAVTWWIDDVRMDEQERMRQRTAGPDPIRTSRQLQTMYVWDALIQNTDRNTGNMLWTSDWKLWLIDHTRAFRWDTDLKTSSPLIRCERELLARLRTLTAEELSSAMGSAMTDRERTSLLARRDAIVKHFDARIAQFGEDAVLYARP